MLRGVLVIYLQQFEGTHKISQRTRKSCLIFLLINAQNNFAIFITKENCQTIHA